MEISALVDQNVYEKMCVRTAHAAMSIRSMVELSPEQTAYYFAYVPSSCRECDITPLAPPEDVISSPKGKALSLNNKPTATTKNTAGKAARQNHDVQVREVLRSTLVQNAYQGLMTGLHAYLTRHGAENPEAERFRDDYIDAVKNSRSPIILATSCAPDRNLKTMLCQLESDVHLGVLRENIGDIGTKYSHVFSGAPDGIQAAKDFAFELYAPRKQGIIDALHLVSF